jgi:DNA-binding NtrC family response regulator
VLAALNDSAPLPRRARAQTLASAIDRLEREMIRHALDESSGNISETARILGLTRRGLYLKLQRLGIIARA